MRVERIHEVTDALYDAFGTLIPQLSTTAKRPTRETLNSIVRSDTTKLWMAIDNTGDAKCIVGVLTLVIFRIPTGKLARIEDVVVEQSVRHQGVGRMLMEAAIECAWEAGVQAIDLTSNPARSAANQMYLTMGFVQRETNVYRLARPSKGVGEA